jgi:Uma2 family endonuclease
MSTTIAKARLTVVDYRAQVSDDHAGIVQLIDGEIVTTMPKDWHARAMGLTFFVLKLMIKTGMLRIAPVNIYLEPEHYYEPDVFWVSPDNPNCKLGDDGFWYGAPDFVAEVLSPSTERYDRVSKFRIYEKHGVREYWLIDPEQKFIEVYALKEGKFARVGAYEEGETFTSPLFGVLFSVSDFFAA